MTKLNQFLAYEYNNGWHNNSPNDRNSGFGHDNFGSRLDAHVPDSLRRRPDKYNARLLAELGKLHILRQEPVTRVDGLVIYVINFFY